MTPPGQKPNGAKSTEERRSRAGLSLKNIKLDKLYKQLLNVVHRETMQLLKVSRVGKLSPPEVVALNTYVRLVKELRKVEARDDGGVSDEELERIAARGNK